MKITNTTSRDLGLSPEVVIPAGGEVEIDDRAFLAFKASPVVRAWLEGGDLVEAGSVRKPRKPRSRSGGGAS